MVKACTVAAASEQDATLYLTAASASRMSFRDASSSPRSTDPSTQGPFPGPGPGPGPQALTLDLAAKKQELRKKIKFFATASVASTLVAEGK